VLVPSVPRLFIFVRLLVRLLTCLHLLLLLGLPLFHLLRLLLMPLLNLLLLQVVCLALRHPLMFLVLLALKFLSLLLLLCVHLLLLLLVFPIQVWIACIGWTCVRERWEISGVDWGRWMTGIVLWPGSGSVAASFSCRYDTTIVKGRWSRSGCYRRLAVIF
jgi:hypothetical protein